MGSRYPQFPDQIEYNKRQLHLIIIEAKQKTQDTETHAPEVM